MKQQTTGKNHKPACLALAQQHQHYGNNTTSTACRPCFQLPDAEASDPALEVRAEKSWHVGTVALSRERCMQAVWASHCRPDSSEQEQAG